MWESFFGRVDLNIKLENFRSGVNVALKALTSLNSSPPPPPVETSKKLGNDGLIKNGLSILHPELEESISIESHNRETILISNFIQDPKTYLSSTENKLATTKAIENKLATTKAIIKDIEGLEKDGRKIPQNIKKIIADHKKNSSIITAEELKPLSDFYIQLADKTSTSFSSTDTQSRSQNEPSQNLRHSTPSTTPPSRNIAPSSYQPSSHPARTPSDHRYRRSGVGRASNSGRYSDLSSSRYQRGTQSDGSVSSTTQSQSGHTGLTGPGARDAVLGRGGLRPTSFQSGDATRTENEALENYGKRLARLEHELNLINTRAGHLYIEKNNTRSGTHNIRATTQYNTDASNIRNKIKTLNENLFEAYLDNPNKIKIVNNAKNTELSRLKDTPSARPSAPLVVTQVTKGYLNR
jgi:hypothetical protein